MRIRSILIALSVALISSCAAQSSKEVEPDAALASNNVLPPVSDAWRSATADGAVQIAWLESFNDAALTTLVNEALANNYNLSAAAANVEQAQALARQAGSALAPSVDLTLGASRRGALSDDESSAASSVSAGLQVSWEADLWGRIRAGVAQAGLSAQAAEADFRFAQYSLAANTGVAYFTAIEAGRQLQIANDTLAILKKIQSIVDAQYREGMGSAQDVALSRSDLATAREHVVTLEGARRDSLRALEQILGRYPGADISVATDLPEVPAMPPAGVPSELLQRRPDVVAAERRVAVAFNAVNEAEAALLPSIALTGNLGGSSDALSELLKPSNLAWTLGANLLAPLFDGGRRAESVNVANAQQKAALAHYGDTALRTFSEVETLLDQGQILNERELALREAAMQAERAYRLAEIRYKEGETTLLDLLSIQQRVLSTQTNLASVQRLTLAQRVSLNLALGGAW